MADVFIKCNSCDGKFRAKEFSPEISEDGLLSILCPNDCEVVSKYIWELSSEFEETDEPEDDPEEEEEEEEEDGESEEEESEEEEGDEG